MLEMSDLMVLNSSDGEALNWKVQRVSQDSQLRLLEAGIADETGALTEYGKEFTLKVKAKVSVLRKGIPFAKRVKNDSTAAMQPNSSYIGWFQAKFKEKTYVTNGSLFLLGQPSKEMQAKEADAEQRKGIATAIHTGTAGKKDDYMQLTPYAYQVETFGGMEFIWLASENTDPEQGVFVPIQAMFFDLIKERYPTASFWVHAKKAKEHDLLNNPIQARVTNRGLKNNVVALVMAVETGAPIPILEDTHGEVSG